MPVRRARGHDVDAARLHLRRAVVAADHEELAGGEADDGGRRRVRDRRPAGRQPVLQHDGAGIGGRKGKAHLVGDDAEVLGALFGGLPLLGFGLRLSEPTVPPWAVPTLTTLRLRQEFVYTEDRLDEKGSVTATWRITHRDRVAARSIAVVLALPKTT